METRRESITSPETGMHLISLFDSYHAAAKRKYSPHHHTSFEIALFKKGRGIYYCNGRHLEFREGDMFIFSTNEEHFILSIDEDMLVMNLHFEPQYIFSSFQSEQDLSFLRIFFDRSQDFCNRLPRENPTTAALISSFYGIEKEFVNKNDNYTLMIKVKLLSMLITMTRELGYVNTQSQKNLTQIKCIDEISKVTDYINKNFSAKLNLTELASIVNMSPNYLCMVFKQINGLTIWEYILIRRIEAAKKLLYDNTLRIIDIQLTCGFQTSANFNKMFKRMVGISPSDYRKSITRSKR